MTIGWYGTDTADSAGDLSEQGTDLRLEETNLCYC